jgi:hypothetical protein
MNGQREFFVALLDPEQPPPSGIKTWNDSDPAVRFSVYRNNVVASLVNALADTFPVTLELVGEAFFRAMAQLFVRNEPPRSRVLAFYGASFPSFIEHFAPAASVPYLADVARVEMLRVRAFHALDVDDLPASALVAALADRNALPDLQIGLHPSVGLIRSEYAVASLWAAHQGAADISAVDPYVSEHALVMRARLDVELMSLTAGAGDFVAHLLQGASLGRAVEQAVHAHPEFDLSSILGLLVRSHAIASITTSSRSHP